MTRTIGLVFVAAWAAIAFSATPSWGAIASGPNGDPNKEGLGFGQNDAFDFGGWSYNDARTIEGNAVGEIRMTNGSGAGAGMSVPLSNGENGDAALRPPAGGAAPSNPTAANAIFTTIGNGTGKLEHGNVVRLSAWFRSDPLNPVTVEPEIRPVLKFEFHRIALATQGTNPGQQVSFDSDVNGGIGTFVGVGDISTSAWTLFTHQYTVDNAQLSGGGVSAIEEIRPVIFTGDFNNSPGGRWFLPGRQRASGGVRQSGGG